MQTNVFPKIYEEQLKERTDEQIEKATNASNSKKNSLDSQRFDISRRIERKIKLGPGGIRTGLIVGFFASFVPCMIIDTVDGESDLAFISCYVALAVMMILGAVISANIHRSIFNKELYAMRKSEADITAQIDEEESRFKKEIESIKTNALREQQEYTGQFEKNAQDMSVQFAESELAKEVIEWMTQGFCKTIDSANRQSHVEQIIIPFAFNIHTEKITCNLGTYDFELHRCRNLNSPVEQTALARAIVSAIQLDIIMKYPKDASGTDVTINIDYSYTEEYPVTTITYVAPNGNYETVRGW